MNSIKRFAGTLLLSLAAVGPALAAPAINTFGEGGGYFSDPKRTDTAIRGYDPVAYFTDGKPVKGSDKFVHEWMGAKWQFASQDHLDKFKAEPAKYAPQYGGYCAYGIAEGHVVKIEPDQWSIVNDKLYLNYDADVSKKWKQDKAGYIKKADASFDSVIKK
ncbi:YHS domain-containing (seleno)protein [Nevskia ramosa]|uniref:YHS domain-containing (seleno)protein n=1 Tax=Nevskia ramosa TaxID=64002 RepID=UPI00049084BE|nr:YHS domain-containing (seleno)protein [Nevskia ramosa]